MEDVLAAKHVLLCGEEAHFVHVPLPLALRGHRSVDRTAVLDYTLAAHDWLFSPTTPRNNGQDFTFASADVRPMAKNARSSKKRRSVPYARGFRPPTLTQSERAIGGGAAACLLPDATFFRPIPRPSSADDWLAQYREEGQTFSDFQRQSPWLGRRKVKGMVGPFNACGPDLLSRYPGKSVCILPLGPFPGGSSPSLDHLQQFAEAFFCTPVLLLPAVGLDVAGQKVTLQFSEEHSVAGMRVGERRCGVQSRHHPPSGRYQLQATSVLKVLKDIRIEPAVCTIAVTMSDLYCDPEDLFVAGWAAGNARVACFSFFRYNPLITFSPEEWHNVHHLEGQGSPAPPSLLLQRCCKLLVHEAAHLLGVDHCVFYQCCMNGSGHLAEDFAQPMHLCPVDLHKLQLLCGFDVCQRYRRLLAFYQQHQMGEEAEWVSCRLGSLKDS